MRTERFNSALLSTLIIVSLMMPAITLLSVSQVSANLSPENVIIRGDANAYQVNQEGDPPWELYEAGSYPPIMAAKSVGLGKVVIAGTAPTCRNTRWNQTGVDTAKFDVLLDKAFQWMKPGAKKVLWYQGYGVYNDNAECSELLEALADNGYVIDNLDNEPITSDLLSPYDILVIPQLQLGDSGTGGTPDDLPDADVTAITGFIKDGKGALIMDGSDFLGHSFYKVQNKILVDLGVDVYFQDDQISDDDFPAPYHFDAEVTSNLFGADYQTATGLTKVRVYSVCSIASEPPLHGVGVRISPGYREGLAGGTLKYQVKVTNVGKTTDNYNLTVSDNQWPTTISPSTLEIENGGNSEYATLSVTIPPGTPVGTEDNVAVIAISEDNEYVSSSSVCLAIVGNRVRPSTDDVQVVEESERNHGIDKWMYVGSSEAAHMNERVFLKFDLEALGTAIETIDNLRLFVFGNHSYVYGFGLNGAPDKNMDLREVDNDDWNEMSITWDDHPSPGTIENSIGMVPVTDTGLYYSWDVKSYLLEQYGIDNVASFCLKAENEDLTYPDNWSFGLTAKEFDVEDQHPYLATGKRVWISISPLYSEGLPGGTLSYTVRVQNTGALHDTYNLSVSDNASPSWNPTISPDSLTIAPGEFDYATVTVTIRSDAPIGENIDNLLVVATSTDPSVSDNYWCVANVSTTTIRPPVEDSNAKQAEPMGNWVWGTDDAIYVGRYAEGPERGFLKFDLSAIPAGTNIAMAKLHLNCYDVDDVGAVVRVHSVDDNSWIERGAGRLMWGNQPSIGSALDNRVVAKTGSYSWDVTSHVLNRRTIDNWVSFALVDLGENLPPDPLHRAEFTSKEYEVRENHPYLEILTADPTYDVRAYISPIFQGGLPGDNLIYTVTVKNKGTSIDTYTLTVDDNLGWGADVLPKLLTIAGGASDNATLSVIVPSGTVCTFDRITVTATGTGVSDDAICLAHLSGLEFKLENLYTVKLLQIVGIKEIDISLRLREDADNLVAKFYGYNNAYDNESVIWENMPWHLTGKPEIPHPEGSVAVENIWLVLVDGTGKEIATVATFTLRRGGTQGLMSRLSSIDIEWAYASFEQRTVLMSEIAGIDMQWPYAPF